jgi:hypothetical protein
MSADKPKNPKNTGQSGKPGNSDKTGNPDKQGNLTNPVPHDPNHKQTDEVGAFGNLTPAKSKAKPAQDANPAPKPNLQKPLQPQVETPSTKEAASTPASSTPAPTSSSGPTPKPMSNQAAANKPSKRRKRKKKAKSAAHVQNIPKTAVITTTPASTSANVPDQPEADTNSLPNQTPPASVAPPAEPTSPAPATPSTSAAAAKSEDKLVAASNTPAPAKFEQDPAATQPATFASLMGNDFEPTDKLPGEISRTILAVVALGLSVLIHIAIAFMIGKLPLGNLDQLAQEPESTSYRIQRPVIDPVVSDPVLLDNSIPATIQQPSLAALSAQLLLSPEGNFENVDPEHTPTIVQPKKHDDQSPEAKNDAISTLPDQADLALDAVNRLGGGKTVDMPVISKGGVPNIPGTGEDNGPSASDQAKDLLADAIINIDLPTNDRSARAQGQDGIGIPTIDLSDAPPVRPTKDIFAHRTPKSSPLDMATITIHQSKVLTLPERLDDDFTYTLTKIRPKIEGGLFSKDELDKYTYFEVEITPRRSLRKLKTIPKDVVFLLDTSGSVPQQWVNQMTAGVRSSLGSLNKEDRFNIVYFSDKSSFFSEDKIVQATPENLAKAQQFLTSAKSKGQTNVNLALSRLLQRDLSAQRAYYLVLISDGVPTRGVMNTRELINLITRDNNLNASIYCVGVGSRQNKELLNFLAYRNKGLSLFSTHAAHAATQIRNLLSRIRYPLIKDVNLNLVGIKMTEVFPHHLPNIHQGERFALYGRFTLPNKFTMRLSGHNGIKTMDFTFGGALASAPIGKKTIPHQWAFWKLHHIYSAIIQSGQTEKLKAQIEVLKERFDLKTLY